MPRILVIGSSNTDMVVKTTRFPQPGETIIGGEFFMFPGGKGANQAVAAVRLGGDVRFVCKVGNDMFGQQALAGFIREGIDTQFCRTSPTSASGVALITVNAEGENEIVVASGANNQLSIIDIDEAERAFTDVEIVLLQLETPRQTVEYAIQQGFKRGKKVILNPAPAQVLSPETYANLFLITPNETEAEILTGIQVTDLASAEKAADALLDLGVLNVIITLGAQGAFFKNSYQKMRVSAQQVGVMDTTAAGDVFNGALAVALAENKQWNEVISFATEAAAISVTRMGAQSSAPFRNELTIL